MRVDFFHKNPPKQLMLPKMKKQKMKQQKLKQRMTISVEQRK
jgi:hypothetical protein